MPTKRGPKGPLLLLIAIATSGCASAAPFSMATPRLQSLTQEEPHFYTSPSEAMGALEGTSLEARVENVIAAYEEELERARRAQGGFLNTTLNILGLILPISGTASSIALSDPDHIQTVSIATGAATTAIMGLNLLLKPEAKAASAERCASFLEGALEAYRRRWDGAEANSIRGTPEEWNTYLTMRATLEPARLAACEG